MVDDHHHRPPPLPVAEISGRKWRAAFGVMWHIILFGFGGMVIPGVAYFVRSHFYLMAVFFWPLGIFFLLFLWVDPEETF